MPFYIRKSVSSGPFRFNLSSSGVGMSVGIKGFRVGTGPRGNYVHMGLGGIYYRATLPSAHRPANAFSEPRAQPGPPPAPDGLTEIASGPIVWREPSEEATAARQRDARRALSLRRAGRDAAMAGALHDGEGEFVLGTGLCRPAHGGH
ncbi:DUF4236 domain-containing protein [Ancylobacter sp. MQZ15Z-1]|uniref:DUF4236 domain-containing protein n=1 Tax=Ancylobacter mangrovi TaxID=2972472 RepID=A0A9X2T261_9HYPH|nr:DUF4236 domain-containing protein [Ancylobacter mangrovi]MCS0495860.1 DUF4236 domain-containing protein [Ancylobacter mangrovi]